tara:strand:- start:147 stop:1616 length:1470 start_codon:yes stop_codon:yes gene_type:complete
MVNLAGFGTAFGAGMQGFARGKALRDQLDSNAEDKAFRESGGTAGANAAIMKANRDQGVEVRDAYGMINNVMKRSEFSIEQKSDALLRFSNNAKSDEARGVFELASFEMQKAAQEGDHDKVQSISDYFANSDKAVNLIQQGKIRDGKKAYNDVLVSGTLLGFTDAAPSATAMLGDLVGAHTEGLKQLSLDNKKRKAEMSNIQNFNTQVGTLLKSFDSFKTIEGSPAVTEKFTNSQKKSFKNQVSSLMNLAPNESVREQTFNQIQEHFGDTIDLSEQARKQFGKKVFTETEQKELAKQKTFNPKQKRAAAFIAASTDAQVKALFKESPDFVKKAEFVYSAYSAAHKGKEMPNAEKLKIARIIAGVEKKEELPTKEEKASLINAEINAINDTAGVNKVFGKSEDQVKLANAAKLILDDDEFEPTLSFNARVVKAVEQAAEEFETKEGDDKKGKSLLGGFTDKVSGAIKSKITGKHEGDTEKANAFFTKNRT